MMTDYLLLQDAVKELERRADEGLKSYWKTNFGDYSPEPAEDWGKEADFLWAVTVVSLWDFWQSAKNRWVAPEFGSFEPLIAGSCLDKPKRPLSIDNGNISLKTGLVIGPSVLAGDASNPRRCGIGEQVAVSEDEVRAYFAKYKAWLREHYYAHTPNGEPPEAVSVRYALSHGKTPGKRNRGRPAGQVHVEDYLRQYGPNLERTDIETWREQVRAELGINFGKEVFRKARRKVYAKKGGMKL